MPRAFAEFEEYELDKVVTRRRDTLIYFGEQDKTISRAGRCVGAFFLQNPGSANPTTLSQKKNGLDYWPWGPLDYSQEQLIPVILNVLAAVLKTIRTKNPKYASQLEFQGYVQLLNLSYIKDAADFRNARDYWEQILQQGLDRDDSPSDFSDFRFMVFGWGNDFRKTFEGARVACLLDSLGLSKCSLIFPQAKAVRSQGELKIINLESPTLQDWQSAIGEKNNYPCGGQNERQTYPDLYVKAVSPILAEVLRSDLLF